MASTFTCCPAGTETVRPPAATSTVPSTTANTHWSGAAQDTANAVPRTVATAFVVSTSKLDVLPVTFSTSLHTCPWCSAVFTGWPPASDSTVKLVLPSRRVKEPSG